MPGDVSQPLLLGSQHGKGQCFPSPQSTCSAISPPRVWQFFKTTHLLTLLPTFSPCPDILKIWMHSPPCLTLLSHLSCHLWSPTWHRFSQKLSPSAGFYHLQLHLLSTETPQHPLICASSRGPGPKSCTWVTFFKLIESSQPTNNWSVPCSSALHPHLRGTESAWNAKVLDFSKAMPLHHKTQPCFVPSAIILGRAAKSAISPVHPAMLLA